MSLGFLLIITLIIVIERALAGPHRLQHLGEGESRLDITQEAFCVWVGLKRCIRLLYLGEWWRGIAGYL